MSEILSCPKPDCGKTYNEPANFCRKCGTRLVKLENSVLTPPLSKNESLVTVTPEPAQTPSPLSLAETLNSPDPRIRGYAIHKIWRKSTPNQTAALCQAAEDSDPEVRYWAAAALERVGDVQAAPTLGRLLTEAKDADIRYLAARALERLNDPNSGEVLVRALKDPDADVCYWATLAIQKSHPPIALPVLESNLAHADKEVREATAIAIAGYARPGFQILLNGLRGNDPRIRLACAIGLGYAGNPDAIGYLVRALPDPEKEIGKQAALALAKLDLAGLNALVQVLRNIYANYYHLAAKALATIPNDIALAEAANLANDPNRKLRKRGVVALGYFKRSSATAILLQKVSDYDPKVRAQAVKALEKTSEAGIPACIEALRSRDPQVLLYARNILISCGTRSVPALIDGLKMQDESYTEQAAGLLSRLDYNGSVATLSANLTDSDPVRRGEAARALAFMKVYKAQPTIIKLLGDSHPQVCKAAGQALIKFGDSAVGGLGQALENSQNDQLRENAVRVLGEIGSPKSAELLLTLLKTATGGLQRVIIEALAKTGETGLNQLLKLVNDPSQSPELRSFIVGACGRAANPLAFRSLLECSQRSEAFMRLAALEALNNFQHAAVIDALVAGLRDGEPAIENLAGQLLFGKGPQITPILLKAANDVNPKVREAVQRIFLGWGAAVIPALVEALKNPDPDIRRHAVLNLGQMAANNDRITKPLKELKGGFLGGKGDPVEAVKTAAAQALKQIEARKKS